MFDPPAPSSVPTYAAPRHVVPSPIIAELSAHAACDIVDLCMEDASGGAAGDVINLMDDSDDEVVLIDDSDDESCMIID